MVEKPKTVQEDGAIKKVTWIGMISLLLLLLLFLLVTVLSTTELASKVRSISEHPITVDGNISDVKTDLALMRLRTERLQSYNQPEDVEKVRSALDELYLEIEPLLNEIDSLYLGPEEDTDALWQTYRELQGMQDELLTFAALPSSTTHVIAAYEEEHLYPLYERFEEHAQHIQTYARNTQQSIFTSAEQLGRSTLVWSLVITAATTLGLFVFQAAIRKMSRRLYEKYRQFEMISDAVDETFLLFGADPRRCDFVSGSAERILGVPADRLREDRLLIYEQMDKETKERVRRELYSERDEALDTMIAYQHPQFAEPRCLQLRSYHVTVHGEEKYIITLTDRTQERLAAQALEDALASAQTANNAKKDFLSRMSHEIRTPMNAIIGMATIAAASIDDKDRVADCLEKIGHSSKHLLMLVNDVLDMSRIESNRLKLNQESFELFAFLNSFVSVVYPQASGKGLTFTEKTTGFSEHTTFLGDTLRLNQILLNLTSNAIKFTPPGGAVSLEVTQLPSRAGKNWIRFVVSDTGIGMDQDALSRLYTPFEQADASTAQKYGGTGLGMSIAQNLVSLMGGYIDVKSKPGEGTTFTVELPFEPSGVELPGCGDGGLTSLKVLVTDDERTVCEHTALLLDRMKIHAEWVLSGAEAVDRVAAAQEAGDGFDVCLIDWKMPEMDGVETTRRIREKIGRDTPIIIISAYDWSEIEAAAREAGANAFITKPLFQSSLYNALVSATNGAFGIAGTGKKPVEGSLQGKHLLLAEDNALNMEIAVTLLEMNGAAVEGVENGQLAVERFLQAEPDHYDAILMDVQMPVMDGCEAARRIRACGRPDAKRIPIIATTANAFAEDVSAVLAAGMDAHVGKPLEIKQLCALLSKLCGQEAGKL